MRNTNITADIVSQSDNLQDSLAIYFIRVIAICSPNAGLWQAN